MNDSKITKKPRKVIHIVKHVPTGALIPMIVRAVNKDNIITNYAESFENRKGFTVAMLQNRWDKCKEDVVDLLQKYEVPGHLHSIDDSGPNMQAIDIAIFMEEYIMAIEKKEGFSHSKLKAISLDKFKGN